MLLTKPRIKQLDRNKLELNNKYALIYIAGGPGYSEVPLWRNCIRSYIQMVCMKNKNSERFDIVGRDYFLNYYFNQPVSKLKKQIGKYFGLIELRISKGNIRGNIKSKFKKISNKSNLLVLRGDIFPVPNQMMLSLMKYSINDILLTGDQSLSDGLSCCPEKNIWYQTVLEI